MKITLNNMPTLKLAALLKRRKMTLKQLLNEFGITTFDALVNRCQRMGVVPPSLDEFNAASGNTNESLPTVNNPSEGIVVVAVSSSSFSDSTNETESPEVSWSDPDQDLMISGSHEPQKKLKKKKGFAPSNES
jgi:hypothetical protein